jgi:ribonuclease PH
MDFYRINGPETKSICDLGAKKSSFERNDRSIKESRPVFLKTKLNSKANGSAYFESGKIKIMAAV